jgi:DNA replication factor GINS
MANITRSEPRIEAIQSIYQLGYMLEEVRVTYKEDAKMSVGNLVIDAKEGDMSSLPRWIAKILLEQGAVEIQSNDVTGYISLWRRC